MDPGGLAHDDTGEGTALVFLHGITMDRRSWAPAVEHLADGLRCLNVDLPGHGDSPRSGGYDVFTQAAVVADFLADRGLDRPVLVGHSGCSA